MMYLIYILFLFIPIEPVEETLIFVNNTETIKPNLEKRVILSKYDPQSYIEFEKDPDNYTKWNFSSININIGQDGSKAFREIVSIDDEVLVLDIILCYYTDPVCDYIPQGIPAKDSKFKKDFTYLIQTSNKIGYLKYIYN